MSANLLTDDVPPPAPKVRFETIGEAWTLLTQQLGVWLGTGALALVSISVLMGAASLPIYLPLMAAIATKREEAIGGAVAGMVGGLFLLTIVAALLGGLLSAGFYRMAVRQVRGQAVSVSDLFQVSDIFLPMLGASVVVGIAVSIGMQFLMVPGYVVGGLWMLAGPLIAERKLGTFEALSASWKALQSDLVMAACYYLVISLVASLGLLVFGIGMIFTMPLFYLGLALVYRDFFPDPVSDGLR